MYKSFDKGTADSFSGMYDIDFTVTKAGNSKKKFSLMGPVYKTTKPKPTDYFEASLGYDYNDIYDFSSVVTNTTGLDWGTQEIEFKLL